VILPRKNERDLRDIPEEIRKQIKLVLVDDMTQVLDNALRRKPRALAPRPVQLPDRDTSTGSGPAARPTFPPTGQPPVSVQGSKPVAGKGQRAVNRRATLDRGPAGRTAQGSTGR